MRLLLPLMDEALTPGAFRARVLLVDDGSDVRFPEDIVPHPLKCIGRVTVLRLRRNHGRHRSDSGIGR